MGIETRLLVRLNKSEPLEELPSFASKLIKLGRQLYRDHQLESPRTVILISPYRKYVSGFIALGALEAALLSAKVSQPEINPGSKVRIWDYQGSVVIGNFEGYETQGILENEVRKYAVVKLAGDQRTKIPIDLSPIEVVQRDNIRRSSFNGFKLPDWFPMAKSAFGSDDFLRRFIAIREIATIVGSESGINTELRDHEFFVRGYQESISFDKLLFTTTQRLFQSRTAISSASRDIESRAHIVILDGNAAIGNHGVPSQHKSSVLVLEPYKSDFNRTLEKIRGTTMFLSIRNEWLERRLIPESVEAACYLR